MRETSNPVFRSLPKGQGGYAQFGTGAAGYGAQAVHADPYVTQYPDQQQTGVARPLTIDDVVTKTGITLAVLTAVAVVSYFLVAQNLALAMPFVLVGALGGLALVLVAMFGRKQDNPAIVLSYAALEGSVPRRVLVRGREPHGVRRQRRCADRQAIVGTIGVFFGMLVVYKTGAIRVTPKFTRMLVAAMFGVVVLMLGQLGVGDVRRRRRRGLGCAAVARSRSSSRCCCIGLAAFIFLLDFDQADQTIRAGAPEKAAWGIALGLTVTLVWLYIEILRLLSYFNSD